MIGICGASGFLGWKLFNYFTVDKMGTYYNNPKPGLVKFDLKTDDFSIFDKCSYVVILSAYAKIKFCEENRQEAYDLNVLHTKRLLDYLHAKGIKSLFISSDASIRPNTFYGLCKLEVDNYIKQEKLNSQSLIPVGKFNEEKLEEFCMTIKRRANV